MLLLALVVVVIGGLGSIKGRSSARWSSGRSSRSVARSCPTRAVPAFRRDGARAAVATARVLRVSGERRDERARAVPERPAWRRAAPRLSSPCVAAPCSPAPVALDPASLTTLTRIAGFGLLAASLDLLVGSPVCRPSATRPTSAAARTPPAFAKMSAPLRRSSARPPARAGALPPRSGWLAVRARDVFFLCSPSPSARSCFCWPNRERSPAAPTACTGFRARSCSAACLSPTPATYWFVLAVFPSGSGRCGWCPLAVRGRAAWDSRQRGRGCARSATRRRSTSTWRSVSRAAVAGLAGGMLASSPAGS